MFVSPISNPLRPLRLRCVRCGENCCTCSHLVGAECLTQRAQRSRKARNEVTTIVAARAL